MKIYKVLIIRYIHTWHGLGIVLDELFETCLIETAISKFLNF
jgi:hypothetical protein